MSDTIHALSSGILPAGVAVVRISGPESFPILATLLQGAPSPPPGRFMLRSIYAAKRQKMVDRGLVLTFRAPHSFTGEDVVELHLHGSTAVVAALFETLGALGSRPADPGEFTRRAFLNGRIDLTEAEALADLIDAETESQRAMAVAGASGRFRDRVEGWRAALVALMAEIEADLDFSDEEDVGARDAAPGISALAQSIETALAAAPIGERIRHGLKIVIVGPPNAGKSSLMNALAARDVAIVTPIAGTTRDSIEVRLDLAGRAATLIDTAGLRETADPVEQAGIARSKAHLATADLVLDMAGPDRGSEPGSDINMALSPDMPSGSERGSGAQKRLVIINKIDLTNTSPGIRHNQAYLSAKTGAGLADLERWLSDWALTAIPPGEPPLVSHARHVRQLTTVHEALLQAQDEPDIVLKAELLRRAAQGLGHITGRIDPETVLDEIFGRFCIGK